MFRREPAITELQKFGDRQISVIQCELTRQLMGWEEVHVDHYPKPFSVLIQEFLTEKGLTVETIKLKPSNDHSVKTYLADRRLELEWQQWHLHNAKLRIISKTLNMQLGAHQAV